jgi:DNA polymerase III alpha subunit (gram-positive type)
MAGLAYYCLDTETTGLLCGTHEIVELSIISATNKTQLTRIVRAEHPDNASLDALKITGKTKADLAKGCSKDTLISDFEKFVNEDGLTPAHRCLVGHNVISFDKRFLWHLWGSQGKVFPFNLYLDTMHLVKAYAKRMQIIKPKVNLTASCDMLKIANINTNWHSAKADTQNCFFLWEKLMANVNYIEHIKTMPHDIGE